MPSDLHYSFRSSKAWQTPRHDHALMASGALPEACDYSRPEKKKRPKAL
jgi:hypothetical protein